MKKIIITAALLFAGLMLPMSAMAATPDIIGKGCDGVAKGQSAICDGRDENINGFLKNIINFMLWLVGILAVVMIIVGGIKYITSGGDANKLTSAKNTILYSVIGLIIAIFAYVIVDWVSKSAEKGFKAQSAQQQCADTGGTWVPQKDMCIAKKKP